MYNLLDHTLTALSVRHTRTFVNKVYDKDPDRDNMLGLSHMLRLFGVASSGYMCDSIEQLLGETKPFIAALGRSFSLVLSIDKDQVLLEDSNGKRRIGIGEFRKVWTGAVLLLEKGAESCEPEIENHVREERNELLKQMALVASTGMVLVSAMCRFIGKYGIGEWLLFVLNLIAVAVCGLLLEKQVKGKSSIGDKVCTALSRRGCSAILDSAAAKPFLSMSWSEIGFGFFLTSTLLTLSAPATISVVAIISLVSAGVSAWSLAYQTMRKEWCTLCVVVQACVLLQCLDILLFGMVNVDVQNYAHVWVLVVYLIVILTVHYVVRYAEEYLTGKAEVRRMKSIVTNPSVFNHILKQQKHYEVSEDDSSVIIGNPEATNTLTVFSNPHCKACADTHTKIKSLLRNNNDYKVQYIFTAFDAGMQRDSRFLISCFFHRKEVFDSLLDEWFDGGKDNPDSFIDKHGGFHTDRSFEDQYTKHQDWARVSRMKVTPTVLLNGYAIPEGYSISDLEYINLE